MSLPAGPPAARSGAVFGPTVARSVAQSREFLLIIGFWSIKTIVSAAK
jgi:hypothetical protein